MSVLTSGNGKKITKAIGRRYFVVIYKGDGEKIDTSIHIWYSERGFGAMHTAEDSPAAYRVYCEKDLDGGIAKFDAINTEEDAHSEIFRNGRRSNY